MGDIKGQFQDAELEAQFRADVHDRMYWLVIGPWLAGAVVVGASVLQAYLRLGFTAEWLGVTAVRAALIAAVLALYWASRERFDRRGYYVAVAALLALLVLFNTTAVLSGAADWDRISRAAIIEVFLIGLTFMTMPREAFWGIGAVWLAHVALGFAGFAQDPVQLLNEVLIITVATLVAGIVVWRFSLSERRAYLDRQALRAARHEADRSNAAKSTFLANMSHEIRTPMTGVLGMLDVALDEDLPAESRQHIVQARESAASLLTILNDVLDYSKIEAEGVSLSPETFDCHRLLEQVEALFRGRAGQQGVSVETSIDAVPRYLRADAPRLRQVLSNLVGNAVKFTTEGGVRIVATWRDDQPPGETGRLRVEVQDTGIGISADAQARLFQRFSQAESSTSRRFGGTGLGLSISRQVIEAMDGQIGVDSVEGKGSTFWFEIPCMTAAAPAGESAETLSDANEHPRLKILVADDSAVNQKIVSAFLGKAGHETVLVDDGRAAVEALQAEPFDVIVMDVQMPVLDGVEATREIRKLGDPRAQTPIIALTANAMEGDREALLAAGMDDYVAKPIDRETLLHRVMAMHEESTGRRVTH